jgi:tetratricopeptide (TPR) repeat protein
MSHPDQLLHQGKTHFQAKDYEACIAVMNELLSEDPCHTEAAWLMKEAQRQWEAQRSLEEFEIYVENLKKEARDLFDKEHYEQCLGMFRFLVELEPENQTLRDYLKLSQQMFLEMIETQSPASKPGEMGFQTGAKTEEFPVTVRGIDKGSEIPSLTSASRALPPPAAELPSPPILNSCEKGSQTGFTGSVRQIKETQATPLVASRLKTITEAEKQGIIEEYLASTASTKRRRRRIAWLAASVLLLATTVAARLWLYPFLLTNGLDIQSNPDGASVFIDNQLKGQTHFHQENIPAGSHELRVEKEGYAPYSQNLSVGKAQSAWVVVQLEKLRVESEPTTQPVVPVSQETEATTLSSGPVSPELRPGVQAPDAVSLETEPKEIQGPPLNITSSVIHRHSPGSCTGRLKIDGNVISFRPAGGSQDGFRQKLSEIDSTELSDTLVIQFKHRTYRFETLAKNSEENHQKLHAFYQQLKRPIAQVDQ